MKTNKKNWWKFGIGVIFCLVVRLLPFRAPNLEPILATQMPFTKFFGLWASVGFIFLSILSYDLITGTLGAWTMFTLSAYMVLSVFSFMYFKTRESTPANYLKFAFWGTIFFDAATGLTVGPLFFNQSFMGALSGQIPFTLLHLAGNCAFAYFLSPIIYKLIISDQKNSVERPVSVLGLTQV